MQMIKVWVFPQEALKAKNGERFKINTSGHLSGSYEMIIPLSAIRDTEENHFTYLYAQLPLDPPTKCTPEDKWKTSHTDPPCQLPVNHERFEVPNRAAQFIGSQGNFKNGVPAQGWKLYNNEWVADTPASRPPTAPPPRIEEW